MNIEEFCTMPRWTIAPEWRGETVFVLGGGTSVLQQDLSLLRGRRVIAVNSSYETYPDADVLYFADRRWWIDHMKRPAYLAFKGRKVTCSAVDIGGSEVYRLRRIIPNFDPSRGKLGPGISTDPGAVVSNRTSLQGAINVASHYGAARIVLLGADMCRAKDGRTHHHSPHKWKNKPGNQTWDLQLQQLRLAAEPLKAMGIEVINTSPISRIDFWPTAILEAICTPSIACSEPAGITPSNTSSDCEGKSLTVA